MTLPFRRRHNDAEGMHDRARLLSSRSFLESLDADDAAWLRRHLESCTECQRTHDAFGADRDLLRSLREVPIEPPRDLWARTSAALDQAAAKRPLVTARSGTRAAPRGRMGWPAWRALPLGAAAGALILVVVLGSVLLPGRLPTAPQESAPVAVITSQPGPTPITLPGEAIPNLRTADDGTLEFVFTDINEVCPDTRPRCAPPPSSRKVNVDLAGVKASSVTISPGNDQLVFEGGGDTANEGKILITPLSPAGTPAPSPTPPTGSNGPSTAPGTTPPGSLEPTPAATPEGQIEIASGVTVVGEVAYSDDGLWLAFSAAPRDGSAGPDLFLYAVGSSNPALRVSDDHQTYFSAWLGGKVLASRIDVPAPAETPGNPRAGRSPAPSPAGGPAASAGASPEPGPPIEGTASSFLLDPATLIQTDLRRADVWLPVVDAQARFAAYWSGTLRSTDGGVTWHLGDGQVVFDDWPSLGGDLPNASPAPSATPFDVPDDHRETFALGHVEDFRAEFDPGGTRLALWVGETRGHAVGRLHLFVVDAATGKITAEQPLTSEPALRRFSIDANRLAWVSPPGQDGQESKLQVLGWTGDTFGEIQSEPAPELFILR